MFDINGKVALITGGASGLGFMYAKELLRNGLKAVTLADVNEEFGQKAIEEITEEFGTDRVIFVKTDVTNKVQFEEAFKATIAAFKYLDILINNAGILNDSIWEKQIAINFNGSVHGMLLGFDNYLPNHRSGSEAVIVNISSIVGLDSFGFLPVYSATKHAIIGLTRAYGTKLNFERSNVKVLAMCPGITDTPLISGGKVETTLGPKYRAQVMEEMGQLMKQAPAFVAKAMVEIIKRGETGSMWVAENEQPPYEVTLQTREMRRKH